MKQTITLGILILFTGIILSCVSVDKFFIEKALNDKPNKILIGTFERRNIKYDPFVIHNFRDTIRFELFKKGYVAKLMPKDLIIKYDRNNIKSLAENKKEIIETISKSESFDVFLEGAISETELGDLIDKNSKTLITVVAYSNTGEKIGEIFIIVKDTIADVDIMKNVSSGLTNELDDSFDEYKKKVKKKTSKKK